MVLGNLACVTHGACSVVPGESFDPVAVLGTVEAERCTSLYGVPAMYIAELADPGFDRYDLSSLRTGMMGGEPCPVKVMKQVRSRMHMRDVAIVCGMTETAPPSTRRLPTTRSTSASGPSAACTRTSSVEMTALVIAPAVIVWAG